MTYPLQVSHAVLKQEAHGPRLLDAQQVLLLTQIYCLLAWVYPIQMYDSVYKHVLFILFIPKSTKVFLAYFIAVNFTKDALISSIRTFLCIKM